MMPIRPNWSQRCFAYVVAFAIIILYFAVLAWLAHAEAACWPTPVPTICDPWWGCPKPEPTCILPTVLPTPQAGDTCGKEVLAVFRRARLMLIHEQLEARRALTAWKREQLEECRR